MKRIKIIGVFLIFILSVIFHFLYDLFPNYLFSILLPVNESIWEHMKLIVTSALVFSIFEYFIYRKKNIKYNNFLLSYSISTLLGVIIYLVIYIPLHDIFGYVTFIAIALLFIIFILVEIISYCILKMENVRYGKILGLILLIIMYLVFWYFTYFPPKINLFYDSLNMGYGIIQK